MDQEKLRQLCRNYLEIIKLRSSRFTEFTKEAHDACHEIILADYVTLNVLDGELTNEEKSLLESE